MKTVVFSKVRITIKWKTVLVYLESKNNSISQIFKLNSSPVRLQLQQIFKYLKDYENNVKKEVRKSSGRLQERARGPCSWIPVMRINFKMPCIHPGS